MANRVSTDREALIFMTLLHTHQIEVKSGVVIDETGNVVSVLHAVTQREAAKVIAELWRDRSDSDRTNYTYWYRRFNEEISAETTDVLTSADREILMRLKDMLMADQRLIQITEED